MKKIFIFPIVILLLLSFFSFPTVAANAGTTMAEDIAVFQGRAATVAIFLSGCDYVKTGSITFELDNGLSIQSASWELDSALMKKYSASTEKGVFTFEKDTAVSGEIFTLTVEATENATIGVHRIFYSLQFRNSTGDSFSVCSSIKVTVLCAHNSIENILGKPATCIEDGMKSYWHCLDCDKNFSDSTCQLKITENLDAWRVIDKLGHSFTTYISDNNATCTADGTKTAHCDHAGCRETDTVTDVGSKLGHNFEWVIDQKATKTATGLKHEECTRCHATRNENTVIPILTCEHENAQKVNGKAATCTENGLKDYWHCPDCGKNFSDSACQLKITENLDAWRVIEKLGHCFTNYVGDGNATCTEDGTKTAHCDHVGCDETNTIRDANSAGHDYEWIVDEVATQAATGLKHEECTRCHAKRNENTVIPKFISEGKCGANGDNLSWMLDENGLLTITGTGTMMDWASDTSTPWHSYKSLIKSVSVSQGVTNIGEHAFEHCEKITSVSFPNSVTDIGRDSFNGCKELESIALPNSVTTIGWGVFYGCSSLVEATISEGLTTISNGLFSGCTKMTSITIPSSIVFIENYAFLGCSSLVNITIKATTPPRLERSAIDTTSLAAIYVPQGCAEAYKTAPVWKEYASIISQDHIHVYSEIVTEPTCTEAGYTTYKCLCGDKYVDSYVAALGHEYLTATYKWNNDHCTATRVCSHDGSHIETETVTGKYVKDTDAACEANEKGHYEATFTNPAFAKQSTAKNSVEVPETKIGHSFTNYVSDNNATCTADGTKTAHCDHAGCNETDTVTDVGSKLGHNFEWVIDKNATKTATGLKHEECTRCHATRNENTVIPILTCEHENAQKVNGKDATCTENGLKEYWHCPDCGKNFSDSACQLKITENLDAWRVIDKLGHSFTTYVSDNNATCTEDGTKTAHCDHAGCQETDTVQDVGSKLGHSFTNYVSDGNATCTEDGTKTAHCDHAGCNETDTVVDPGSKLGHAYGTPTYVWNGDQCTAKRVCSHDGSHIETETVNGKYVKDIDAACEANEKGHYEASFQNGAFTKQSTAKDSVEKPNSSLGHNFEWVIDQNATKTATGLKHEECTRCHATRNENTVIPILTCEHENAQKVNGKDATCTENGLKDYWHCPECEMNFADSACKNEITGDLDTWRVIDKLGHSYGTPTYVWNGDQCMATRVCSHDSSHIETETVKGIYVKDTDAACEANEKGHYEASFQNGAFTKQSTAKDSVEKPNSSLGHNFEWVIDQNATKTATGLKHEECTRCHATRNENTVIPILTCEHENAQKVNGKDATCTENGLKDYWHCPDCGKNFSDSACQLKITENLDAWRVIDKLGHSFTTYISDNNATCTADGTKTAHCDHAGCQETDTIADPGSKLGHSFTHYVSDGNATCTEDGTKTAHCNHAGCQEADTIADPGSKLGHDYGTPTYVWNGDQCTATRVCSHDDSHIETGTVTGTYVKDSDATCTENEKGHYEATFTNPAFAKQSTAKNSVEVPATKLGHSFTNYVSDNNATCTADGTKTAHCDHAGCDATDTITDVGSKLGHNYDKPTYTWNGDKCTATMVCLNDSGHEETETATAKYVKDTNATCTENEKGHYEVTFQNGAFEQQFTEKNSVEKQGTKLGHNYVAVVTPPTETAKGYTTHTCSRCHDSYVDSYTDPIPAVTYGDINGDDNIDAFDYQMLKAFVLGTFKDVTDEQKEAMDVNHDGCADAFDYQMVKAHVLGTYVIQ